MRSFWGVLASCCIMQGAVLTVSPISQTIGGGDLMTSSIVISSVTDLFAFQFDVLFDPHVVSVTAQSEGGFLLAGGPTFFVPGSVDNVGGSVTFIANTLLGPVSGVSGMGTLITLDVLGMGPGVSSIVLANVVLLDSSLNVLTADVSDGSITVEGSVPEPGTWFLSAVGLLIAGAARSGMITGPWLARLRARS